MTGGRAGVVSRFGFLVPILVVGALWQLVAWLGLMDSSLVSSPGQILRTFWRLSVSEPVLLTYVSASLYRLLAGYVSGCLTGIALGFLMGCSRHFYRAIYPIVGFLIAIPTICWVPVLLITVGMGTTTVIVTVFLGCVFPVAYVTLNGVRGVGRELIWASEALGARGSRTLLHVLLPGSLPSIITGLRLAVGYSWRALVGAEMLAAASGVGFMIYAARAFYDVDVMFVGLVTIALGGLIMDYLVLGTIERKTVQKWGLVTKTW